MQMNKTDLIKMVAEKANKPMVFQKSDHSCKIYCSDRKGMKKMFL